MSMENPSGVIIQESQTSPVVGLIVWSIYLVIIVVYLAAMWKIFTKAGKPGWAAIVPLYNFIIMLEIIGRPVWWIALFFVPVANIVISLIVAIDLAKVFGKSTVFGVVGLWLFSFVGYLMLAFGKDKYVGSATTTTPVATVPAQTPPVATTPVQNTV